MSATAKTLFEKMRQLPPQRLTEVEDFVDFLRSREDDVHLTQAAVKASEATLATVWNNNNDAAYDRM